MTNVRRLIAIMIALLLAMSLFVGCGSQEDAAPVVDEPVVTESDAVSVADTSVKIDVTVSPAAEGISESAEIASTGSGASIDVKLYLLETSGWLTLESSNVATITQAGGQFELSVKADRMQAASIGSLYLKDVKCYSGEYSQSLFTSASVTLDKVTFNGTELKVTSPANEEAITGDGVFDYCFINQWALGTEKFEGADASQGSFKFTEGKYNTDDTKNEIVITFSVAPISDANCRNAADVQAPLLYTTMRNNSAVVSLGSTVRLFCDPVPSSLEIVEEWSSSDPSVATVDNWGVVTPVSAGKCWMKATCWDNGKQFDAYAKVTVLDGTAASLGLYLTNNYWSNDAADEAAIIDAPGTYTITMTTDANSINGIYTMYFKDTAVNAGTAAETMFPNANIQFDSFTVNGVELALENNTDIIAGSSFDICPFNIWGVGYEKIIAEGGNGENGWQYNGGSDVYGAGGYALVDATGASLAVEGDNVIVATITVNSLY